MNRITLCLKKGLQIGVMGAALATSLILMAGCSTGSDGNETETGDDKNYATPYTKNIGNGFNLYVAMGDNGTVSASSEKQVVTDTNHYLDKTQTYINVLVNGFEQSLSNRPAAQNYFAPLTNGLKSNSTFYVYDINPGGQKLDLQINNYANQYNYIFTDIIKNLNTPSDRAAFSCAYQVLANEAYKEGLGIAKTNNTLQALEYQKQKEKVITDWEYYLTDSNYNVNLQNVYQTNNFTAITNLLDQLIVQAANNMNQRQNLNVQAGDLRQVINLALTTDTLRGTHDSTIDATNYKHNGCVMSTNFFGQIMYDAANEAYQQAQN